MDVTAERWKQITRIYELAADHDEAARDAFLLEACGGDEELRREVQALFREDAASGVLDRPLWEAAAPLFEDRAHLPRGSTLGPYRIDGVIGAGGMGQVFSAVDTRLDRAVAIKVMPSGVARDVQMRARFAREAKAIAALTHPNICRLYDVGRDGDIDFLVMELLEGETLAARLASGPLPLDRALALASEIAGALDHAHRHGIVHRDLKPANIMLTAGGAKLLDFGLAKFRRAAQLAAEETDLTRTHLDTLPGASSTPVEPSEADNPHATRAGAILGTVPYMAPEQIRGGEVDARSDLFSFGAVIYEMLTGRQPFVAESTSGVRDAILEHEPAALASLLPQAPARLADILRGCLVKDPALRWQTAADVQRELKQLEATLQAATPPLARRRNRIAAIALLLTASAAIWVARERRPPPTPPASANEIRAVAVLPFTSAASDEDVEYLCDGLTDSLIHRMSSVPSLTVMARSTVFNFKGNRIDPREAGRRLGVDAIVTGTVSQRSGRLRISTELVQVATGVLLWGNTFDRALSELVTVQDEIANAIVDQGIRVRVSGEERRALISHPTDDAEAYEWYLRARHAHFRATEEDLLQARALLERAVTRDPKFAGAYHLLAANYVATALDGYERPIEAFPQANRHLRRAQEIDRQLAGVHTTIAAIEFFFNWDWQAAEREWNIASTLPRGALPTQELVSRSYHQFVMAGPDAALRVVRQLRTKNDPLTVAYAVLEADYLFHAGRFDAAAALYEKTIETEATPNALFGLAEVLYAQARFDDAIEARRRAHELAGDDYLAEVLESARGAAGYQAIQQAALAHEVQMLRTRASTAYVSPLDLARAYAQLGDTEQAFEHLDAAFADRAPGLVFLQVDRAWDAIRADPRFVAAVRRVGLP